MLQRRKTRVSDGEQLEFKHCLAAVAFVESDIECCAAERANSAYAADLDGDGDLDVLSASYGSNQIAWYENTDGAGHFGNQQEITTSARAAYSVFAADLDGDGDLDALSASSGDNKIAWYENIDGAGQFGQQQVVTTAATDALSVYAADLDGDGDLDILSASSYHSPVPVNGAHGKIAWYENIDGTGHFGDEQVLTTSTDGARSVSAADLDSDGDLDIVSASPWGDKVAWYENTDGAGRFGDERVVTRSTVGATSVSAADLDGDGDLDIVSASGGDSKIAWYENTDGAGHFGDQSVISTAAQHATAVSAADLDGDGDLDVLSAWASYNPAIAWFENADGAGTFGDEQVITTAVGNPRAASAADFDGDGDLDVLYASAWDHRIAWYENTDGAGTFGNHQVITTAAGGASAVHAADLDGDGDRDVVTAAYDHNKVAWYENTDVGHFGDQRVITVAAEAAHSVHVGDLDGDGDLDVVSASGTDVGKIAWYENTDGAGHFGDQQVITMAVEFPRSVTAADLDGDGDLDVLSASGNFQGIVAWYENTTGTGQYGDQQVITTATREPSSVSAVDLDGDGDLDVLSASYIDNKIAWYENTGGGYFGDQLVITKAAKGARSAHAADLDGDGDLDVLSVASERVAWHENTDGAGNFSDQQVITTSVDGGQSVYAADLDGDGDLDVLSASNIDNKIAWYENTDSAVQFGKPQVITTSAEGARAVSAADLDGDGDQDILSASFRDGRIAWYENRILGDSNDDGVFDSGDLDTVFQAGKYEDGIEANATFNEGDWNQDSEFDSGDLVFAFEAGHYVAAATPHESQIAAAVDLAFADRDTENRRAFVA